MRKNLNLLVPASTGLCLMLLLVASSAKAGQDYFDVNGATAGYGVVNGGSYSWDANNWSTASGGGNATTAYTPGNFPRFYGTASYTVTVNNDESMAGMYQNGGSGHTLTINAAGSGDLNIVSGDQGFLAGSGTSLIINAPVVGSGGLAPELTGTIYLNGNNSYSGNTTFGYSSVGLVYFNNNNSFGTGAIQWQSGAATGQIVGLLNNSATTVTLANTINNSVAGNGFNFASSANSPVVLNGDVNATADTTLKNNGPSTASLTLNGNLNVSAGKTLTLSGNNGGTINVNGNNFGLLGNVSIGATGASIVTVRLTSGGTLASAANVTLAGGTLNPAGQGQSMGATTLTLAATSAIDFSEGAAEIDWANSSALAWTGILHINGWTTGDAMEIGTDATGLTQAQLNDISFNNGSAGGAYLTPNGYLVVPEPSTMVLGTLGGLGMLIATFFKRFRKN